jgi:hypothetical protein
MLTIILTLMEAHRDALCDVGCCPESDIEKAGSSKGLMTFVWHPLVINRLLICFVNKSRGVAPMLD